MMLELRFAHTLINLEKISVSKLLLYELIAIPLIIESAHVVVFID